MNKVIPIFKSKDTQSNSFECLFSSGKTFNSEYKNSKNPYKPNKSAVLKEKLHLSVISYTYPQLVTLFNYKAVFLSNLSSAYNHVKSHWISDLVQKQTISICKSYTSSAISYTSSVKSYTHPKLVTLHPQLVTPLSVISYTSSVISYTWCSTSAAAIVKMTNLLKLLKLKEKLVINKWSVL